MSLLLSALLLLSAPAHADEAKVERKLKAAFILQFPRFIEWKGRTEPGGDFAISVVDDADLAESVSETSKGRPVKGRKLTVIPVATAGPARLAASEVVVVSAARSSLLKSLKGCHCLTVGNGAGSGAVISFFRESDTLRFEISRKRAAEEQLEISSELLDLAKVVD